MKKLNKGISLIETMIVISVAVILMSTLWFILSPIAKTKGLEARITSDLKQINMAIQIYKLNHDDKYPLWLDSMPDIKEIEAPDVPDGSPLKGVNLGACKYKYMMNRQAQLTLLHRAVPGEYDPNLHAIVKFPCVKKELPGQGSSLSLTNQGWVQMPLPFNYQVLSVFEDGSVRYAKENNDWHAIVYHFGASIITNELREESQ